MARLATRYIHDRVGKTRGGLVFGAVPPIVAAVSAGIGVAIVAMFEPKLPLLYPVRVLPLSEAPSLQISLFSRAKPANGDLLSVMKKALSEAARRAQ